MKTKNIIIRNGVMAGLILVMGACASEHINEPSMAGLPQASDYQIGISVDDLNNVELNILDKNGNRAVGVYPVWYVNESTRPSTALTYRDLISVAGEYPVEMKVGNSNGVSEGSVTATITIAQTIFDFAPYMRALTNGSSKEWAVDGEKSGHMGCGSASNPTEWWNAVPGDKEAMGVYENILTFADTGAAAEGAYTFDPGTAGTFYVNTVVHSLPGYTVNNPDDGVDFRVSSGVVNSTFSLQPEGANLYLVLAPDTPFPYVPSEAGFANPKYRIVNFSRNEITIVQDLEGISWQYILAPKAEAVQDVTTTGFKYDYEHNLWKDAEIVVDHTWFADANWNDDAVEEPTVTLTENKGIKFHTPANMGNDQWQGQVHVHTNIEVHSDVTYDFSCNVNVPKAGQVTVKVQKLGDDDTFLTADRVNVEPDGSIVWFADVKGFDGTLKIAFDFAGFGDCDIEVSNIVFKEHQYDDGTIIPASALAPVIPDSDNIFANFEVVKCTTWFANNDWDNSAIAQPEIIFYEDGYSFIAPAGIGTQQWQGQVHVWTNVKTSAENKYDFSLVLESDKDLKKVTVKLVKGDSLGDDDSDDAVFIVADQVDVEAGTPYLYFFKAKPGVDTNNLQLCMDYAGAPEKANITVSEIKMQVAK
ncbi:MAG: hypothetical protein K2G69_05500 [Muribaculaceae bacterium]|nr:hypothetical protein [Muribaculaceae bacterium]